MIRAYIVFTIISLLLVGCNEKFSNNSIQKTKESDGFNLVIEAKKGIFQEEEEIQISSTFKYTGEKEIYLDQSPSISVAVRNHDTGEMVKVIDFKVLKKIIKKGDTFSQKMEDLYLKKGKYDAFVQTSNFSVGSSLYNLSTAPITFEVK